MERRLFPVRNLKENPHLFNLYKVHLANKIKTVFRQPAPFQMIFSLHWELHRKGASETRLAAHKHSSKEYHKLD